MNKIEKDEEILMELAAQAKDAVDDLKAAQKLFMQGKLTYEQVKQAGKPLVDTYNDYAKALAKARNMPYKPISLGYFLR